MLRRLKLKSPEIICFQGQLSANFRCWKSFFYWAYFPAKIEFRLKASIFGADMQKPLRFWCFDQTRWHARSTLMEQFKKGHLPQVKGLILAGGRSTRMGRDKGLIEWHGLPQRIYLAEMLDTIGIRTFISCRPDQALEMPDQPLIVDKYPDTGPLGAIASAFAEEPSTAWLVVACDMPFLNTSALRFLLDARRPDFAATAFRSPAFPDDVPDPMLAIWEPSVMPVLTTCMRKGKRSARHVLTAAGAFLLDPPDPIVLTNTNTPEEFAFVEPLLKEIVLLH